MKKIINAIKDAGFDAYRIIETESREHQLYLLKDQLEAKRNVDSHYYEITVYQNHTDKGEDLQGEYTFVYKTGADLRASLEQAKLACNMIKNRRYTLMSTATPSAVRVLDPSLSRPAEIGDMLCDVIYEHSKGPSTRLSSAELYLKKSFVTLCTSTGIEVTKEKGLIEIEVSLLAKKGKSEQELNFHFQRRSVDDLRLEQRLREYARHTRNMLRIQIPKSGRAAVLVPAADIYQLLSPVVFHSSGRAKDKAISRFKPKERIIEAGANTFTMKSSGLLPYGLYSDPFDNDGISGQDHTIIDQGVFQKFWTTKRYADYLGVEPTGSFKNIVIEPDRKMPFRENEYYEIIQFSDLSPDPVTGDFVAEIRFAYHVKNSRKTPIKGGSVSGNIFAALNKTFFSGKGVFEGNYQGPQAIALKDLTVSGG